MAVISYNRNAFVGTAAIVIGPVVCFAIWGWHEAAIFFVGAFLGSIRVY